MDFIVDYHNFWASVFGLGTLVLDNTKNITMDMLTEVTTKVVEEMEKNDLKELSSVLENNINDSLKTKKSLCKLLINYHNFCSVLLDTKVLTMSMDRWSETMEKVIEEMKYINMDELWMT